MLAVEISDLTWKYAHTTEPALKGLDLTIATGSTVGIVGPNEAGKSTLVYTIKGLIPHSINGVLKGSVRIFGEDVTRRSGGDLAADVGLVFADPEAQFTAMTVEEELVFGMENLGLPLPDIERRLHEVSQLTGISQLLDKSPYDISGGQKQRVAIASVLAMEPRILILDEPTSMIDPVGKEAIFDILRRLKARGDLTILVVEHNIEELVRLVDRMLLIVDGQIAHDAPTATFFDDAAQLHKLGVQPPDVTAIFADLAADGLYQGPLPLDLAAGRAAAETLLAREQIQ